MSQTVSRFAPVSSPPIRSPEPLVPPMVPVQVKASSNDPTLHVGTADGGRTVLITGVGSNNGFAPSVVTLQLGGKQQLSVPVRRGEKPEEVLAALKAQLPKGYEIRQLPSKTGVAFSVVKKTRVEQPGPFPTKNLIHDMFETARAQGKIEGRICAPELQKIVDSAKRNGLTQDEKRQLATEWASQFDGAKFNVTKPAAELYAKLQKELGLPVLPLR